jgi:Cof subfamily protein (haloacid dehalogenase superfamily)
MMDRDICNVKLLVCDLDGTLTGPAGHGLEIARHTLDFCRRKGIRVTVATGRAFAAAERLLVYLGIDEPIITNGGALIARIGQPPVYEKTIDRNLAQGIALELQALGYPFFLVVQKHMYTHVKGQPAAEYSEALGYDINIVGSIRDIRGEPTQIVLRVPSEECDGILRGLHARWLPRVKVIKSLPHLIEIQPSGVSKAKAVEFLADYMNIDREQVLAIGDGLNDLDMLMWAGMRAAVANAHEIVKRNVSYVSKMPYAEGVRDIIEEFAGGQVQMPGAGTSI